MLEKLEYPRALRRAYLAELDTFRQQVRRACHRNRIDYVELDTDTPLDVALSSYLASRAARR